MAKENKNNDSSTTEEFDEEAYKKEKGYDALYDKEMAELQDKIDEDGRNILKFEDEEGELVDWSGGWTVTNERDNNKHPGVDLQDWVRDEYAYYQEFGSEQDKIDADETLGNISQYTSMASTVYFDLEDIWAYIQEQKANAAEFTDENGDKNKDDQSEPSKDAATDPTVDTPESTKNDEATASTEVLENLKTMYQAWDPRLQRIDCFLMDSTSKDYSEAVRIPFASTTAATAFSDQVWTLELGAAEATVSELSKKNPEVKTHVGLAKLLADSSAMQTFATMNTTDKVIMPDTDIFTSNNKNWGVQSIVNPYSLTKLMGGLEQNGGNNIINYMYDIRDRRRFYGVNWNTDDVLAISNPTVTQLIEWGNQDSWGRTPYSFQDFVYCKYFGLIPNNRLITLRRYAAPTYDNLQFENMFGDHNTTTLDEKTGERKYNEEAGTYQAEQNTANKTFSPHATVVTWFGGDTGNQLSSLMNFTTGIPWTELTSEIYNVTGDQGESKQSVIDTFLGDDPNHFGLSPGAEHEGIKSLMEGGSFVAGKITSFGKFALSMNGKVRIDQAAFNKLSAANKDPFDQTFKNRIKGPINRIDKIMKRKEGIEFSQSLNIKCSYSAKSIGGINPKAALLDVMGNCLEMVSPHAVFWGGGHHFMLNPQIYPWHDKGWRDSFMAKIYDGKFLGEDGVVNTVLKGIKHVGEDGDGNFSMDTLKSTLGTMGGEALSLVGAAINSIAGIFGGGGLLGSIGDMLNSGGASMQNIDDATAKANATSKVNNMFKNLKKLWSNRMIAATVQPNVNGMGGLLVGEPVGEWHMTVGNPFNPILVIGNLICKSAKFSWDEELGPDDFPTGFTVEYELQHAMARDSDAIQSMFNRGMGKYYTLPDYMTLSSERTTYVDEYTKGTQGGKTGQIPYVPSTDIMKEARKYGGNKLYQSYQISAGHTASNAGNPDTRLITKFQPLNNLPTQTLSVNAIRTETNTGTTAIIRSLAATRKMMGNS